MNIPESWLRAFCNPRLSGRELADKLTMAGVEVESYEPVGPQFAAQLSDVVVGEVLSVERHPNADKLTVCKVKAGKETVQVVCGAPNVRVGMKAPLGENRQPRKSAASKATECCASARELGLSDDHSGLLELPADARPGADVRAVLGLDDHVLTLKLTPNRADCLSVLGIAREVSALTGAAMELPPLKPVAKKNNEKHPGAHQRAGGLRAFRRAGDPQRGRQSADAGLDAGAAGARRPALDLRAGRRHELRDARARPAAARLRPGQAARARSTCAGGGRARKSCC